MRTKAFLEHAYGLATCGKDFKGSELVRLLKLGIRLKIEIDGKPLIRAYPCHFPSIEPDKDYPLRIASLILEEIYKILKQREQYA